MTEPFSRRVDAIPVPDGVYLTPLPTGDDHATPSASLIDHELNDWLRQGRQTIDGVPIVGAVHLVALEIRALLELTDRHERGESVDASDIRKHHNDALRLLQVLAEQPVPLNRRVPAGMGLAP